MTRADEIDLAKRRVEACFEDYRLELIRYAKFMDGLRKRRAQVPADVASEGVAR